MANRFLRPSQFVTTYGTGSLIRVGQIYRVIPSLSSIVEDLLRTRSFSEPNSLGKRKLEKFCIQDPKLESMIKGKLEQLNPHDISEVKIFRLPSNADMQVADGEKLYGSIVFPRWSICKRHNESILAKLERRGREWVLPCPRCEGDNLRLEAGVGVRFIRACHRGHMDDIDWPNEVHLGASCDGKAFSWNEQDHNFEVKCLDCSRSTTFGQIKNRERAKSIACSGYVPELQCSEGCIADEDGEIPSAKIILKNASNLRVSHVLASLLIPPYSDRLYQMLKEYDQSLLYLPDYEQTSQKELIAHFEKTRERLELTEAFFSTIRDYDDAAIRKGVRNVVDEMKTKALSEIDAEDAEFSKLLDVSRNGYPKPYNGELEDFLVHRHKVREFRSEAFDLDFVVTPIDILTVTQAQVGYSREVGARPENQMGAFLTATTGRLVPTFHSEKTAGKESKWFIGSQMRGEGLFLHVKDHDVFKSKDAKAYDVWKRISDECGDDETRAASSPNHVWWHSLAHGLVNTLSIDSGFQSTAIHEKTYSRINPDSGKHEGGILFYAVQTGGDGTLGGLTGMVKHFEKILERVGQILENCSNDPICIERQANPNRCNGAACHACLIISETSCHKMNQFLDRKLLLGAVKK